MENKGVASAFQVKKLLLQFMRFGVTGVCNAIIDILALNFFLWRFPTHAPGTIIEYNTAAYMLGAMNSYVLNKYWTFRRGKTITGDELLRFITVNVIGVLSNDCIFWAAGKMLHPFLPHLLVLTNVTKVIAVIGTAFISYTGMHLWVFKGASQSWRKKLAMAAMKRQGKATGAKVSVILRALREMFFFAWKWRREERHQRKLSKEENTTR